MPDKTDLLYKQDGMLRQAELRDIQAGLVLRTVQVRIPNESGGEDVSPPFSENIVTGVFWRDTNMSSSPANKIPWDGPEDPGEDTWTLYVALARPFCRVSNMVEDNAVSSYTTCLTGVELYEVRASRILDATAVPGFRVVLTGGEPTVRTT